MEIFNSVQIQGYPINRVKLTENLYLDEYIPFQLYKRYVTVGDRFNLWSVNQYMELLCRKISPKLIEADQKLRDRFGPVTINTWWGGGDYDFRGFRTSGCGFGTELSDHYQGRASDKTFKKYSAEEVREDIKKNWQEYGISIIEEDVTWVHTSVAWVPDQKQLKIVKP